jgi:Protein of unknown function VcgC/VcgE (DUF2780)
MRTLALILVVPVTFVYAQSTQPPVQNPAPPPAVNPDKPSEPMTVEQTASPEIVGAVAKDLSLTPWQAQGAAGTLFGLAKTKLSAEDFAKVAGAVPNMEGLLKAAPAADAKSSAVDLVTGAAGGGSLGSVASVAGPLMKLGLKPDTIAKLAPSLIKAVQTKGGAEVASLLTTAFK